MKRSSSSAAAKGDDDAWREMVDQLGQRVYSVAYHFSLKREDAEELSQEIFLKIFENLHRYDGSYPLVAWVVSLARNLCIDRYRRRKRERSFRFVSDDAVAPLLQSGDDPAAQAIRKERTKMLFWALSARFPRTSRRSSSCATSRASPTTRSAKRWTFPTAP